MAVIAVSIGAVASLIAIVVAAEPPERATIAEFRVAKRGDLLAVPIVIEDVTYSFVLDTGSGACAFDECFESRLVTEMGALNVLTGAGIMKAATYESPPLRLGPFDLGVKQGMVSRGFHDSLMVLGLDLYGVIGMNALRDKVFTIDFDQGMIRFIKDATGDCGTPIPLKWKHDALFAVAEIEGAGHEEFLIDTGMCGFSSGEIRKELFDKMLAERRLRPVGFGHEESLTLHGNVPTAVGRIGRFSLGRFTHRGLIMSDAPTLNALGLGYLSRYIVTFDMTHATMYLRPGKYYDHVDRYELSGIVFSREDCKVVIGSVARGSASEAAGLREFDWIVSVDNVLTDHISAFELSRIFTIPGRRRVVFERDGVRKEVTVVLRENGDDDAKFGGHQ